MLLFRIKYLVSLSIVLMMSCQSVKEEQKSLNGLWCEPFFGHCNYFENNKCLLNRAEIRNYQLIGDTIIVVNSEKSIDKYLFDFKNDSLLIKNINQNFTRKYYQPSLQNDWRFESFSYSILGSLVDYNIDISYDGIFFMELNHHYHKEIKAGYYSGKLDSISNNFLHQLIKSMPLEIPNELDLRIISDIDEWAAIFKFKENEKRLYHNYLAINDNHKSFSLFMHFLPFLLKDSLFLKNGDVDFEVERFREIEFERNLKLQN